MWGLAILVAWVPLVIAVSVLSARLAWRMSRRWRELGLPLRVLAVATALPLTVGLLGAPLALLRSFLDSFLDIGTSSVEPSQKARRLAEGISEAMNCSALALLVGIPVLLVAALVSKRDRRGGPPDGDGHGP
jgi:biopolymer transport protein ExbB/TolQ